MSKCIGNALCDNLTLCVSILYIVVQSLLISSFQSNFGGLGGKRILVI